ncbi:hypothetical protein UPYG_G00340980 [Umbra pygmaea]|uniref:CUB domain-containing protein 1-like n=1 Tax=Umbra pygmaea TaxID=75934 RepID=A0ABD0WFL4_UMBPY
MAAVRGGTSRSTASTSQRSTQVEREAALEGLTGVPPGYISRMLASYCIRHVEAGGCPNTAFRQVWLTPSTALYRDMQLIISCAPVLLGIVILLLSHLSECMQMSVHPDQDVTVTVSSSWEQCFICTLIGSENDTKPTCHASLDLVPDEDVTLLFNCTEPLESAFTIRIKRNIKCTTDSCSPASGATQPSLFLEFNRTLVWELSVPENTVLSLDFPGDGLKEMTELELCQDGYQYNVTTRTNGVVDSQTYCRNGPVSHLDIQSQVTVFLQVQKGGEVDSSVFTATAKPMKEKSKMISVTPEPNTIVTISRDPKSKECDVCVGSSCNSKVLILKNTNPTPVEFNCLEPQNVFKVEINRQIDCTERSCSRNIVQAKSSLLLDFNRTFTWDLKAPSGYSFQLDFPLSGMRQIAPSETCSGKNTYAITNYQRSGPATIGMFCPGGTITAIQVLYKGRVSLHFPGNRELEPLDLNVTVGTKMNMLAVVKVNLPRGVSDTDFLSANYPRDFPDDSMVRWDFKVPGRHNYTVNFLDYRDPLCIKNDAKVEYQNDGETVKTTLMDPQPTDAQGSFSMTLFNCVINKTTPGLSLNFSISVMRSSHPVVCIINFADDENINLHIENSGSDPDCEMRKDSVIQENITVLSGTEANLSFLDCSSEVLHLTASKTIGCQSLDLCSMNWTLLTVPEMPTCLRTPLQSFTWHLNIPPYSTVNIFSPTGRLKQSLPGQQCSGNMSLHLADGDGSSIGYFCSDGIIGKVQVQSNVSVTATAKDLHQAGPFFNVSFSKDISETIVYTVHPRMGSPALLATPNWPNGMKPFSKVSWIVKLPGEVQAELLFTNISQPKCGRRHTQIMVQTFDSMKEVFYRNQDEAMEDKIIVFEDFYLNMSSCVPEEGQFSVLSKLTLRKTGKVLMGSIIGAVGAVLLLILIVLPVVVCVLRKKKRTMVSEASIYLGKKNIFKKGDGMFPTTRPENESSIYTSMDDTVVYGHLLRESGYEDSVRDHFQGQPVDTYRTFMSLTDGVPEITETPAEHEPETGQEKDGYRPFLDQSFFMPQRPRTPIDRQDSMGFTDQRMMGSELGTFKSTGDINTIRLSGSDQILDPVTYIDADTEESM